MFALSNNLIPKRINSTDPVTIACIGILLIFSMYRINFENKRFFNILYSGASFDLEKYLSLSPHIYIQNSTKYTKFIIGRFFFSFIQIRNNNANVMQSFYNEHFSHSHSNPLKIPCNVPLFFFFVSFKVNKIMSVKI